MAAEGEQDMPYDATDPETGQPIRTTTLTELGPILVVAPDWRTCEAARVIFGASARGMVQAIWLQGIGVLHGAQPRAEGEGVAMYYVHAQHPQAGEAAIDVAPVNRNASGGTYLPNRLRLVKLPHGKKYTTHAGANRLMFKVLAYLADFPQLAGYTLTVRSETPAAALADTPIPQNGDE